MKQERVNEREEEFRLCADAGLSLELADEQQDTIVDRIDKQ